MKRPANLLAALALVCLAQACAVVDAQLAQDFAAKAPRIVRILPPASDVGDDAGAEAVVEAATLELQARGYDTQRPAKKIEITAEAEPMQDVAADAQLSIRILRWDYRARVRAADFEVAASFRLTAADGSELWRVDEHTETSSYDGLGQLPDVEEEFRRLAARLAGRVFDTLPARIRIDE